MNESDFQVLSTVQGVGMPKPGVMASANVLTPTTFLTVLTGNTVVKTINPPVLGTHMLAFQFAGIAGVDATGNILTAKATVAGEVLLVVYNPATAKYVPVG